MANVTPIEKALWSGDKKAEYEARIAELEQQLHDMTIERNTLRGCIVQGMLERDRYPDVPTLGAGQAVPLYPNGSSPLAPWKTWITSGTGAAQTYPSPVTTTSSGCVPTWTGTTTEYNERMRQMLTTMAGASTTLIQET